MTEWLWVVGVSVLITGVCVALGAGVAMLALRLRYGRWRRPW